MLSKSAIWCHPVVVAPHSSIAVFGIKAYVEMYEGKIRKQTVNYENFPKSTHAIMVLFMVASLAFHISIWPAYGWNSIVILTVLVGYGVLLQFALMVPTYVQNIVGFVLLTFFLQEYS